MNTPVSFELAKLLKEKGFEQESDTYYTTNGELKYDFDYPALQPTKPYGYYDAPTIAEVIMWLYEKHGIWIEVSLIDNSRGYYFDYTIITSKDRDFNDEDCFDSAKRIYDEDKHNSPTEAYEAAIEYVLTKLI